MARTKEFNEEQILDKAIDIFWYKGYNGTSAQDLVTHLGLSRSSLYDTFGDKHTLFARALGRYQQKGVADVKELIARSGDMKEVLKGLLKQAVLESSQDRNTKGCFAVNSMVELALHDKEIARLLDQNRQDMEIVFLEAVKKGQELGQITKEHSALSLSRFLYCTYSGIRVLSRSKETAKEVYDDILKVFFSIL
ncbi:TetR/AcrR family transcriptional regulator [Flavobacterium humi]|uniref:TetR/AcrR family transcriptional regulator n=1 Tax=Flavobacterium humi TaxID=2562683 RepID=A0A4Z0L8T0_9FLAO|nr:TetR/AcrR family transcriptional regulator [Flavobacterium humi]TGD57379.1 TetR/AcrR family transcriptional regulator [Flavobacterium humi]